MLVILVSKPNPVLPDNFDEIMYVNGSIYNHKNLDLATIKWTV